MGWSTRELAELAGTTLKTVRHYHAIGLLPEPERASNGYKQYKIGHLIRLLRIRRLVDLGVALSDISAMEGSGETTEQALRQLDAELAASIERQQRVREELAVILRDRSRVELPSELVSVVDETTDAERSLLLVSSRLFGEEAMQAMKELHSIPRVPAETEFDQLEPDAPEEVRQRLAELFVPLIRESYSKHPVLASPLAKTPRGEHYAWSVVGQAMHEVYNEAQLDVLTRVNAMLTERTAERDEG
ncbi:MerR family transcriptional regulator [Saccharopolyspora sp. MS10]|uniref:MerR family transcriptional regulator n=1 Tax=Saccharopolyspora sp. MS10 TaxID=3385973 RepID=UPI0039A19530